MTDETTVTHKQKTENWLNQCESHTPEDQMISGVTLLYSGS